MRDQINSQRPISNSQGNSSEDRGAKDSSLGVGSWRLGVVAVVSAATFLAPISKAQIGRIAGQDWNAARADAQRTSWIRTDAFISKESMTKPDFKLQWKVKLDNVASQMTALTSPTTVTVSLQFKPLTVIGGSSNRVYAIDNETGVLYWQTQFTPAPSSPSTIECPGGMTAGLGRTTPIVMTTAPGRGGARGRGPFMGGVGKPGEGVPAELMSGGMFGPGGGGPGGARGAAGTPGGPGGRGDAGAAAPAAPGRGAPGAGAPAGADAAGRGFGAGGPGGGRGGPGPVYAISSDGVLRRLGANSGKEVQQPLPFLPANARVPDVIVVDNVAYAASTNGCGGVPNGVWAMELGEDPKSATTWKTGGASPAGPPAFSSAGILFVAIGRGSAEAGSYANAIVALEPKTLTVKDWFTQPNADFTTSPVIFKHKERELVAAGTSDGRVVLLDSASLGGGDHATPLHVSAPVSGKSGALGQLATWEDPGGTRWIATPVDGAPAPPFSTAGGPITTGGVVALKLTEENSQLALQPAWASRDMMSPGAPIVVNGVVFAASTGEYRPASGTPSVAERVKRSRPAVLYALDAATGKELWNSGKTLTSFITTGGLWTSVGQAHVATYDGTIYTFGFPLERY